MSIEYAVSSILEPPNPEVFSYADLIDLSQEILSEKDMAVFDYLIILNDLFNAVQLRHGLDGLRLPSVFAPSEFKRIIEARQGQVWEFLDSYLQQGLTAQSKSSDRELELFELGKNLFSAILTEDLGDLQLAELTVKGREFVLRWLSFVLEFRNSSLLSFNPKEGKPLPLGTVFDAKQKNQDLKLIGDLYWFKDLETTLATGPYEGENAREEFVANWLDTVPGVGDFTPETLWAYSIRLLEKEKRGGQNPETGKAALQSILDNLFDSTGGS